MAGVITWYAPVPGHPAQLLQSDSAGQLRSRTWLFFPGLQPTTRGPSRLQTRLAARGQSLAPLAPSTPGQRAVKPIFL